ncbi:hypothetical protein FRC12_006871 [Ceratobasidium sp. 428]|nr:hypothetical protein FRC12_006871 [Ceratobasidium sp. 428]
MQQNFRRLPKDRRKLSILFKGNIDILMANLILSDIVMSLGAISDVYWAHHRQVFCGGFCNAQGAIRTIGGTATALSTLSIAIYTFLTIYRDRRPTYRPLACVLGAGAMWLWAILWAVAPLSLKKATGLDEEGNVLDFFTPTPWWCWINGRFKTERVLGEYLWLWLAGAGSILLYVPAYYMASNQRNTAVPEDNSHIAMIEQAEQPGQPEQPDQRNEPDAQSVISLAANESNNEAAKLLYVPFFYTLCVLPWSIIRWAGFVNQDILKRESVLAPSMVFFGIFSLMGFFNVGLILWTRPTVLGLGASQSDPSPAASRNISPAVSRVSTRTAEGGVPGGINRRGRVEGEQARVDHQRTSSYGGPPVTLPREF